VIPCDVAEMDMGSGRGVSTARSYCSTGEFKRLGCRIERTTSSSLASSSV
jgi:hypothetical protein